MTFAEFARTMAPIAAVAIAVTAAALRLATRRSLVPTIKPVEELALHDQRLAVVSGATVVGLMVALLLGAPVVPASLIGAALVVLARPATLRQAPVSPPLLGSLLALFGAAAVLGASPSVQRLLGHLDTAPRVAIAGTIGSAVTTNLATVAVLAPVAVSRTLTARSSRVSTSESGLTPIGSLATILWRDAARRAGEPVSMRSYLAVGVPLSVVLVIVGTAGMSTPLPTVTASPTVSGLAGVVQRQNISFPS